MALRVTSDEVKEIIPTNLDEPVMATFINAASLQVDTWASKFTTAPSTALQKEMERWYAAHLIAATRQRQAQSRKTGDAQITYQGQTGMGLKATLYGQQVLAMDPSGTIAEMTSGKERASVYVVPTETRDEWNAC